MTKYFFTLSVLMALITFSPLSSHAAGGGKTPPSQDWHFSGPFGTFDRAALQRGFKVYRNVCAACHGLKRVAFRNLEALGYDEAQIKSIAAEYSVVDGPDDEGEMFERTALPSDRYPSPYPNDNAARAANGALPPDLSLITKARANGANYLYALMTGYKDNPPEEKHIKLSAGQYYNEYMPGYIIAMAPPLSDGVVAYEDETPETVSQYAKDLTEFLVWAAEPEMEKRKAMGINVLFFLIVFAGVMYAYKKRIWADVKK